MAGRRGRGPRRGQSCVDTLLGALPQGAPPNELSAPGRAPSPSGA